MVNSTPNVRQGLLVLAALFAANNALAEDVTELREFRAMGRCEACDFTGLDLSNRRLTSVDFSETRFANISFKNSTLNVAIFDRAHFENVDFSNADLSGASFSDATLINVDFTGANMTATVFENAILENTNLLDGELCFTQMPDETNQNRDCN